MQVSCENGFSFFVGLSFGDRHHVVALEFSALAGLPDLGIILRLQYIALRTAKVLQLRPLRAGRLRMLSGET